jgi:choline-sulfatase
MQPKNMLFIMSDEHQARAAGCYGHPFVRTPNIDRLAAAGTRFAAAYTASPICVPARAAFATGRRVHTLGNWCNAHPYTGAVEGWGHRLQAEGHHVLSIGKLHYRNDTDPTGFDEQIVPMHVVDGKGDVMGAVRDRLPVRTKNKSFSEKIGPGESPYTEYDRKIADRAAAWLKTEAPRFRDKPWCLFVSFVCPHFPLIAPPRFYEMYPAQDMPLPEPHPDRGYIRHPWAEASARCQVYDDYFTDATRRIAIASYYALCSFMDDNIGQVLKALDDGGLTADTRIAYTSDHGENLGKRGLWGKSNMYEHAAQVPLILAGADVPAGRTVKTAVSHLDAYQTILDCVGLSASRVSSRDALSKTAAGRNRPPTRAERDLPGASLYRIAAEPDDDARPAFSEYHAAAAATGAFMLRRGRHKLIYYVDMAPELFDLEADPEELNDLASIPAHADLLRDMEAALRRIADPEAVDRRAKADQAALVERHGGRDAVLKKGAFGGTPAPGYKAEYESGV